MYKMRTIIVVALLLISLTAVLSASTGKKPKPAAGAKKSIAKKIATKKEKAPKQESSKAQVLRSDVIFATGNTGVSACVPPGTVYFVTSDQKLIRSDPAGIFKKTEVQVAENVAWAFNGYDDGVWYVDTDGKLWRLHYQGQPQEVPDQPEGVQFSRTKLRNYDEGLAVTTDGALYHYVGHEWILDESAQNVRDIGIGNGGSLMYVDTDSNIFKFDWKETKWAPYEQNGKGFDMYDPDTIVVFDEEGNAQKRINGTWTPVKESKCTEVFINTDSFICVAPNKEAKLLPY